MGSDGMTLDSKGNLYLTGKGVTVVNPAGEKIAHIDVPENWTANVCFGGKKRKMLFITAMKSVYTLEMKVKGANWGKILRGYFRTPIFNLLSLLPRFSFISTWTILIDIIILRYSSISHWLSTQYLNITISINIVFRLSS